MVDRVYLQHKHDDHSLLVPGICDRSHPLYTILELFGLCIVVVGRAARSAFNVGLEVVRGDGSLPIQLDVLLQADVSRMYLPDDSCHRTELVRSIPDRRDLRCRILICYEDPATLSERATCWQYMKLTSPRQSEKWELVALRIAWRESAVGVLPRL